jgi:hypothetical protein
VDTAAEAMKLAKELSHGTDSTIRQHAKKGKNLAKNSAPLP